MPFLASTNLPLVFRASSRLPPRNPAPATSPSPSGAPPLASSATASAPGQWEPATSPPPQPPSRAEPVGARIWPALAEPGPKEPAAVPAFFLVGRSPVGSQVTAPPPSPLSSPSHPLPLTRGQAAAVSRRNPGGSPSSPGTASPTAAVRRIRRPRPGSASAAASRTDSRPPFGPASTRARRNGAGIHRRRSAFVVRVRAVTRSRRVGHVGPANRISPGPCRLSSGPTASSAPTGPSDPR
nr:proline-rich receptor-like protein kinase PERK8 [Aegilops tauschii subsp. strangulata]